LKKLENTPEVDAKAQYKKLKPIYRLILNPAYVFLTQPFVRCPYNYIKTIIFTLGTVCKPFVNTSCLTACWASYSPLPKQFHADITMLLLQRYAEASENLALRFNLKVNITREHRCSDL